MKAADPQIFGGNGPSALGNVLGHVAKNIDTLRPAVEMESGRRTLIVTFFDDIDVPNNVMLALLGVSQYPSHPKRIIGKGANINVSPLSKLILAATRVVPGP